MPEQRIAERYLLGRKLGEGAMGSVWLAEDEKLGCEVALKLLHGEAARNAQTRKRFEREARIAAHIRSTHVVKMLDSGTTNQGQSFIVMEYLQGESLEQRLLERKRLSAADTARIVSHVCRALTKAHAEGLVHRDLKPGNIFITPQDDDEIAKILDFGVAKATDLIAGEGMDPTKTGALLGTPFYMSPEQAKGLKTLDHRTDLWALGVIVFECLTGKRPFRGSALGPLMMKVTMSEPPAPSQVAPGTTTPEIDEWLGKALQKEPDQRFQSAQELADSFMIAAGTFDSMELQPVSNPPVVHEGAATDSGATDEMTAAGTVLMDPAQLDEDESGLAETTALAPEQPAATTASTEPAPSQRSRATLWVVLAAVALVLLVLAAWLSGTG